MSVVYLPVAEERLRGKSWLRSPDYSFASAQAVAPIIAAELGDVARVMPLAFLESGGRFEAVALLSLTPGRNLFVDPDGRWLGTYVPAVLRGYPFRLASSEKQGEFVLCIAEDAVADTAGSRDGQPFFDAGGALSPELTRILAYLTEVQSSRVAMDLAVQSIAAAGLLRPWDIKVRSQGKEMTVAGLKRIDEEALNALDAEALFELRKSFALPVVYAQMLAMGHTTVFEGLSRLQGQQQPFPDTAAPPAPDGARPGLAKAH